MIIELGFSIVALNASKKNESEAIAQVIIGVK